MVEFYSETDFELEKSDEISRWISSVITMEGCTEGELVYVFCDDKYLHKLNMEFLDHDTLTDIISFDNSLGKLVNGEIYISVERVRENATDFDTKFTDELHRVIIHGVLHLCGYKDKSKSEEALMRQKENEAMGSRGFR